VTALSPRFYLPGQHLPIGPFSFTSIILVMSNALENVPFKSLALWGLADIMSNNNH
jgi:hypothetical protein